MSNSTHASDIEKAHGRMMDLLDIFDTVCRKHSLQYWFDYGTLLGAVRHRGFIPWDDDLDVRMLREDYEKFLALPDDEMPEDVFLQTRVTDPHSHVWYAKLRDRRSTFIEDWQENRNIRAHQGIFMDIFPVNAINSKDLRQYKILSEISKIFWNRYIKIPLVSKAIQNWLNRFHNPVGQILVSGAECMHHITPIPRSSIFPLGYREFEGGEYPVPKDSDYCLRQIFGPDYMVPPSPEKRKPHSVYIGIEEECRFEKNIKSTEKAGNDSEK